MEKLSLILLMIALASVLPVVAAPVNTFTLVDDGKPKATIVLAKEADKAARFGAAELNHFVKLITGAELPIVTDDQTVEGSRILLGESKYTRDLGLKTSDLASQEYMIKMVNPSTLVLMGKDKEDYRPVLYHHPGNPKHALQTWPSLFDEMGTMYAVYDFLRDFCGVNWLNPSDHGTVIPEKKTLSVSGKTVRREPFMDYRGGLAARETSETFNEGGGHWQKGSEGAKRFNAHAYAANHAEFGGKTGQLNMARRAQNRLFQYRMKAGGEKSPGNHSFNHYYERFWFKKHKNFESYHPEFFAEGYHGDFPPQLCYSNPDTINQVIKDVRDYFDNGGHRKRMSNISRPGYTWGKNFHALEPMDNPAFCKCDKCRSQYEPERKNDQSQHSTYWFRFVNKVAREIKKSHPEKKITVLAYMTHEGLPTDFELEDNVCVYFCLSANRMPYSTQLLGKQFDRMQQWHEQTDNPLYVWLYHTFPVEMAHKSKFKCFPGFFSHELKRQFDIFREYDIRGIFHCGFNGEVENYVTYRLMDNPDLDIDQLLNEYFSQYGKAGTPLRKMYELIEKRYCNPEYYPLKSSGKRHEGHQNISVAWGYLGNAETMEKLQNYMDEARNLAETQKEKARVQLWNDSIWSYMKTGREHYVNRMSAPMPEVVAPIVSKANGNPDLVDWKKAASLGKKWYQRGGSKPASLALEGKICHDGKYLYIELIDHSNPEKIQESPQIAPYDDWEIFLARQKALPFRQYMIGPTAETQALSYGEVNWRYGVKADEYAEKSFGLIAETDMTKGYWETRLAFPLKGMLEKPIKPGETIYMNIIRISNPELAKQKRFGIDTWVSYTTVKEIDRLGKIKLSPMAGNHPEERKK